MDFRFVGTVKNKTRAWWKWFLSSFKRDWKLSDHPISVREHDVDPKCYVATHTGRSPDPLSRTGTVSRKTSMASDPTSQSHDDAEGSSTSSSSSSSPSPVAIPEAVWPGMTLNWGSPFREILLHAELPFWLLVVDCSLRVTIGDCTLELSITSSAIEIQRGKAYKDSHSNTAIIEKVEGKPSDRAAAILAGMKQSGFTLRTTRTLISIKTNVLGDAIAAIQEGGRRRVDAQMYFRSFVHAHLAFVNKTINAYPLNSPDRVWRSYL